MSYAPTPCYRSALSYGALRTIACLIVATLGFAPLAAGAAERVYFIAADEVAWDFAPSYPNNPITGEPFTTEESVYLRQAYRPFLPASLMYFCSGKSMHFSSGVDNLDPFSPEVRRISAERDEFRLSHRTRSPQVCAHNPGIPLEFLGPRPPRENGCLGDDGGGRGTGIQHSLAALRMTSLLFDQFTSRRRTDQPMRRPSFQKVLRPAIVKDLKIPSRRQSSAMLSSPSQNTSVLSRKSV